MIIDFDDLLSSVSEIDSLMKEDFPLKGKGDASKDEQLKSILNKLKPVAQYDFSQCNVLLLQDFIRTWNETNAYFQKCVKAKAFKRYFWIIPYTAWIKSDLDKHFQQFSKIVSSASKTLEAARQVLPRANAQREPVYHTDVNRPIPPRLEPSRVQSEPVRRRPLRQPHQISSSNASQTAQPLSEQEKRRKISFLEAELGCSPKEAENLVEYIELNKNRCISEAKKRKLKGEPVGKINVVEKRTETNLERTLQFDWNGKIWIYENRKKQGDVPLGGGGFKVVTQAIDYQSLEILARPVGRDVIVTKAGLSQNVQEIAQNELEILEEFGDRTPGIVQTFSTAVYVSKKGMGKRSAIQAKYENLTSALQSLSLKNRMKVAADICRGLKTFHARGYLHRDLKPPNILLKWENGTIQAVITDFGLTCRQGEVVHLCGSTGFVAPEYLQAYKSNDFSQITQKIDIWSLGQTFEKLFAQQKISKNMRRLIDRMLDKNPAKRPSTEECFAIVHREAGL
jgi:protein kinase-like protein